MLLDDATDILGWPSSSSILFPPGAGPSVLVELARDRIGAELNRLLGSDHARVGLLFGDPLADSSQAPIAVVCEFSVKVDEQVLKHAHRLSWNFCRAPLLVTLEPGLARAWSCCEQPDPSEDSKQTVTSAKKSPEIVDAKTPITQSLFDQETLESALHWISLSSGQFFRLRQDRFSREGRADERLVRNLKRVRDLLVEKNLSLDTTHDLLARIIFVQFLFDRKDSKGQPALSQPRLDQLFEEGSFSRPCHSLEEILESHDNTYSFFRWLDGRFNGDLFPHREDLGTDKDPWAEETAEVTQEHLSVLGDFVSGRLDLTSNQGFLWRQYSFDTIPLEFISSIYEAFVRESSEDDPRGVVYTPSFLVDFVLDSVLPWNGVECDLRILDPACGSGIFLVKAFQRLVHRWKRTKESAPRPKDLANLLEHNLYGVDTNSHAIRVASFSLYLAMCDEIDPKSLWEDVRFPLLRERTLAAADYFTLNRGLFRDEDREKFDIVVGNPPWGKDTIKDSPAAQQWAKETAWPVSYADIGPLFIPRCVDWLCEGGSLSLLQPVSILIKHGDNPTTYRKRLFREWQVQEVTNLAACRFNLFRKAVGPSCVVTLTNRPSSGQEISYIVPKPRMSVEDNFHLLIEPQDVNYVLPSEAGSVTVWTTLMWGGRRDLALMKRLARAENLQKLSDAGRVKTRWGVIKGNGKKSLSHLDGRPILYTNDFPDGTGISIDADSLPTAKNLVADSKASTSFVAFESPQVLIKHRWSKTLQRWRSAQVKNAEFSGGVICNRNYVSVHSEETQLLHGVNAVYNSRVALYYLLLSSHMAVERPVPTIEQLLSVPLPDEDVADMGKTSSPRELDRVVEAALGLKDSDRVLVQDFVDYTLPDYVNGKGSVGRQPTNRGDSGNQEPDLRSYAEQFLRVLRAGFGADKVVGVTILSDTEEGSLPFRVIAIHLGLPLNEEISMEQISHQSLIDRLRSLNIPGRGSDSIAPINFQNVIRAYVRDRRKDTSGITVYLVKPDRKSYWTKSASLRDADEVAADITTWAYRKETVPA